jgi:hypothetical protein
LHTPLREEQSIEIKGDCEEVRETFNENTARESNRNNGDGVSSKGFNLVESPKSSLKRDTAMSRNGMSPELKGSIKGADSKLSLKKSDGQMPDEEVLDQINGADVAESSPEKEVKVTEASPSKEDDTSPVKRDD